MALPALTSETLSGLTEPYGIHILEFAADTTDMRALVSLVPTESVAVAASKMKGRATNWLSEQLPDKAGKQMARGYFAITTGSTTASTITAYLDQQGEHHGYTNVIRPPVFVRTYERSNEADSILRTDHAVTRLRFHIVMATWRRRGVFGETSAEAVSNRWLQLQPDLRFVMEKISFVPDHVHVALTLHPAMDPASVVVALMNAGQEVLWRQFDRDVIDAGVARLWQPSAYIGSFGDLTSNAVSAYVANWERDSSD